MRHTTYFKRLVYGPEIVMIPGVGDALSARLAQRAGFKAIFLSGYAASASLLGAPDVGLLSMTEMAECAQRIVDAVDIPLFADGDNGHGNATNVVRTMKRFEKAGVAAIFFEDQVLPKRCGHMSGKQLIPAEEMAAKIRAAVDTRVDRDLLIMARTDALSVSGIDDAIERMHRYLEAGADLSFVESPETVEQMQRITREISAPNMANMVPGGRTPILSAKELEAMGFAIAAYPTLLTYAMARAGERALAHLRSSETVAGFEDMMNFDEFNRLIGLDEVRANESRYYGAATASKPRMAG
jgi:2-methylisocitrate lyase-like PEP mutase family enzyme